VLSGEGGKRVRLDADRALGRREGSRAAQRRRRRARFHRLCHAVPGIRGSLFFPGTSVLQTRLRDAIFVPWHIEDLERDSRAGSLPAEQRLRAAERRLVRRLKDAGGIERRSSWLPSSAASPAGSSWALTTRPSCRRCAGNFRISAAWARLGVRGAWLSLNGRLSRARDFFGLSVPGASATCTAIGKNLAIWYL
jgi:hypothetical protein